MAYVTYKNRNSTHYRFTTTSPEDPAIEELREMIRGHNKMAYRYSPEDRRRFGLNVMGIRIRPRGSRLTGRISHYTGRPIADTHDTPKENATHYDVYTRDYYDY